VSHRRASELGLGYCALIWGSTFIVVKGAVRTVDPALLVALRFLLAAGLLLPFVATRSLGRAALRRGVVLGLLLGPCFLTQTVGLSYTTAANSGFVTGLFVIFVPLGAWLLGGARPSAGQWLSCALGVAGLALLTGASGFNRGDAMTLLTAVAYAAHVLAMDRVARAGDDPIVLTFHQFWTVGALALAVWAARPVAWSLPPLASLGTIVFLAVGPTLSAFFIMLLAQRHTQPARAALILLLEPVFSAVFAWGLGSEAFLGRAALGGGLVVLAMAGSELWRPRTAPAPA
jgi:drug/metabolite transporter (DMT)-like permease